MASQYDVLNKIGITIETFEQEVVTPIARSIMSELERENLLSAQLTPFLARAIFKTVKKRVLATPHKINKLMTDASYRELFNAEWLMRPHNTTVTHANLNEIILEHLMEHPADIPFWAVVMASSATIEQKCKAMLRNNIDLKTAAAAKGLDLTPIIAI